MRNASAPPLEYPPRPPDARITSIDRGNGWVTVRLERRARPRSFNIATDEIPALLAELGKYVHPVTVTRLPGRGAAR
jgi:hypothetical protein